MVFVPIMDMDPITSSQEAYMLDGMLNPLDLDNKDFFGTDMFSSMMPQYVVSATATGLLPATDDYPGELGFGIQFDQLAGKSWEYSPTLKKVFLKFNSALPVVFRHNFYETPEDLRIRAVMLYIDTDDVQSVVRRCHHHLGLGDKTNHNFEFVEHVLRADTPEASYDTDPDTSRTSVVVPLGRQQPGALIKHMYRFMCKNSCPSGMNRRATQIIFTLENFHKEVIGRTKLMVRICSCPKRDKEKEEADMANKVMSIVEKHTQVRAQPTKRKMTAPPNKKVKIVVVEEEEPLKPVDALPKGLPMICNFPFKDHKHKLYVLHNALSVLNSQAAVEGRPLDERDLQLQELYYAEIDKC